MQFTNHRGVPVDPVPFFVVAATAFTVVYSFGPSYLAALGVPFGTGIGVCTLVCGALVAIAYHGLVWRSRPELRGVVPAGQRIHLLWYAVVSGIAVLALLSLPFVT
jgi:hypothetical protein